MSEKIQIHCSHDKLVQVEKLVPNPKNPNTHPERQIDILAKVIQSQGFRSPITVSNLSGFVIKGHGRLMASRLLGMEKVPVDYQDYETEAEEWADMIADNRIAELSDINFDDLTSLLKDVEKSDLDLSLTGYDETFLTNSDIDYSILDDDDEDEEEKIDELIEGTKRGHVIDFNLEDYDKVTPIMKTLREQGEYIGGIVLTALENYLEGE